MSTTHSSQVLLATMALIKANADVGRTHLDNFTPFVLEVMRPEPDRLFAHHEVAAAVSEMMGLTLPARVAESLLKRLARQKQVVRDQGKYRLADCVVDGLPNLGSKQSAFMRDQQALIDKLVGFASRNHAVVFDRESAASALYAQIEADMVDLLRVEVRARAYKRRAPTSESGYVISDFIAEVSRADSQAYEAVLAAAKGTMLAAAIQIPNLEQIDRKFTNTTLYIDAPLLLQLVGLEGPESQNAVVEVLRVAQTAGARIACFEHSVDEAEGVIHGNAEARRRPGKVPSRVTGIQAWAVKAALDHHDLVIEAGRFRNRLAQVGVTVGERPDHNPRIEVSEVDLREALQAAITYRSEEPMLRDLDSLVAIHNLRGGRSSAAIETCRAVLITDNDAVARVARTAFSEERHLWPIATTMSDLATILYLKSPQEASTLPSLLLVAEAYAGLEPGSALWTRFLTIVEDQESKGQVTAEDIALLCHSEETRRFLMEATLGRPERVTEESVAEILERAKRQASEPARQAAEEADRVRASAEADRDDANDRLRSAEAGIQRLTGEVESAKADAKSARDWSQRMEANFRANAQRDADKGVKLAAGAISLLLIVSGVAAFLGRSPDGIAGHAVQVLGVAGLVLGVITSTMGGTLVQWLSFIRDPLATHLETRARQRAGLASNSTP